MTTFETERIYEFMASTMRKIITRWLTAIAIAVVITFSFMGEARAQFGRQTYSPSATIVDLTLAAPVSPATPVALQGNISGTPIARSTATGSLCEQNGTYAKPSRLSLSANSQLKLNNREPAIVGRVECDGGAVKAEANAAISVSLVGNKVTGTLSVNGFAETPYFINSGETFASATSFAQLKVGQRSSSPSGSWHWQPNHKTDDKGGKTSRSILRPVNYIEPETNNNSVFYLSAYRLGKRTSASTLLAQVRYPNSNFQGNEIPDLPFAEIPKNDITNNSLNEISTIISYNVKNPVTNETVMQGDFAKIKGVYQGHINLNDNSIDFVGVKAGTLEIQFPGHHTNKWGKLIARFDRGCLTQTETEGIFSGWLPPVGTCDDFSISQSTAPNFRDFNFDYNFSSFSKEVDFTLEFSENMGVGIPEIDGYFY